VLSQQNNVIDHVKRLLEVSKQNDAIVQQNHQKFSEDQKFDPT
jgi:hypothetical protein